MGLTTEPLARHTRAPQALDACFRGCGSAFHEMMAAKDLLDTVVRIVLTWYPAVDGDKLPWAVVIKPTEPLLAPTRRVVPPLAGVDVSPVVWVAILSLLNEVLAGPQGVLILMSRAAP